MFSQLSLIVKSLLKMGNKYRIFIFYPNVLRVTTNAIHLMGKEKKPKKTKRNILNVNK